VAALPRPLLKVPGMKYGSGGLMALLFCGILISAGRAADAPPPRVENGLALTPPLGWNSWNKFGCNINEGIIRQAAEAMVSSGMKDAGYRYIVIDDCWHGTRDAHGDIQADPQRFPSGIGALAAYVHGLGLKFGIYSDAGTKTCAGRPGSRGYEYQDARQYAAWGVDYLKYDWCNTGTQNAQAAYLTMSDALRASGRDIVFSLCEWGTSKPWLWAKGVGNLWRTTGDISDVWEGKRDHALGVLKILDLNAELYPYAGPGHWNDPDMLEVGNGGMSEDEYRAHFSMWAMLAAPLMAGNDLSNMDAATKKILLNKEVIAVDQDVLGTQAHRAAQTGSADVWVRPLAGGGRAVALLNRDTTAAPITVTWQQLDYPDHLAARIRDLWQAKDVGTVRAKYTAVVPPHSVVMLRVQP
jgi:alpha-galactosidase